MKRQIAWRHWRFLITSVTSTLLLNVAVADGATLTVFSPADSGAGTLRQAILDASPGDTINFAINFSSFPHQVGLTSDELLINKNLTINGPGADKLTVGGFNGAFGIFRIAPASVTATISGLTINGGSTQRGGGIFNTGTLTINNCTISNNFAYQGGGVANDGVLTVTNSTISYNLAKLLAGQSSLFKLAN
jgi:hypothetical protein